MHPDENDQLIVALRDAARVLADHRSIRDLEETLGQIVAAAVDTIPSVDAGSIFLAEHGHVDTRHPTSDAIRRLDERQGQLSKGLASPRSTTRRRTESSSLRTSPVRTPPSGGRGSRQRPSRPATAG